MADLLAADHFSEIQSDNPYWNENSWFSVSVPERRIHGLIQYCFRPNMGLLVGGPVLWDPSGTQQSNCLYYNWSHLQAIPDGAQKFNMTARNSLSVRTLEPHKRYKIDYDRDEFFMNLVWEAIAPPHQLETGDKEQQKTAAFHVEQPGRMKGVIRRAGESYAIDCWSMRDCSSGPYDTEVWPTGSYFWGIGEHVSFLTLCIGSKPEARTRGGFLLRDGKIAALASGTRTVLVYRDVSPELVLFEGVDTLGRKVSATGAVDQGLIFTGYTDHTVVWALTRWECDGKPCWGDTQEFYPSEKFRRIARGELKLGALR